MNKIYRIIWNNTLGLWVVTSELGRGKTKSAASKTSTGGESTSSISDQAYRLIWNDQTSSWVAVSDVIKGKGKSYGVKQKLQGLFVAGTFAFLASPANATDITASSYTPGNANNSAKSIAVGSDTVNLNGTMDWTGSTGANVAASNVTLGYNAGYVTGSVDPNGKMSLYLNAQNNAVLVFDPVTQSNISVNTYVNSNFLERATTTSFYVYGPSSAGGGPFVSSQIANVAGGGVFNMNANGNVGNNTVKDTVYVQVTDGTANWNSVNTIIFAAAATAVTTAQLQPYTVDQLWTSYSGSFNVTTTDGPQAQSVTDLASFQAYNTWLVQQLKAGKLGTGTAAQGNYNSAIALAYSNTNATYTVNPQTSPVNGTDPLLVPTGTQIGMLADGVNATGHITATGSMSMTSTNSINSVPAFIVAARNGGTIINDGTLETGSGFTGGVSVSSGGHFINNGVYNSRTYIPDLLTDAGSTHVNNGTVNIRPSDTAYWLDVMSGDAVNHGAVNVGTTAAPNNAAAAVRVRGAGSFTNDTDGLMYIGRAASTITTGDPLGRGGADVSLGNGSYAIQVLGAGANVNNKGTIIIGDKVQKGYGIYSANSYTNSTVNSGTIEVRGHYNAAPSSNVGMYTTNGNTSAVFDNAGTINLTGINVIGLQTKSNGKAQSSGTINVISGMDEVSLLRNYGIWSEGNGAQVNLSGTVNLSGDGAIGVHARSLGNVTTSGNGNVVFSGGTKQIGYFAYGTGATINNTSTGTQDVSTEGSTLFRMEDGADFTGGAGASSILTASGKDSTAVLVTGRTGTDVSAFNSGGMTINTSGENAVAVLVEGGAQGKIASTATINLTGAGSVAGVVDGQKHALDGSATGTPIAGTLSNGTLAAGAAGFGTGTLLVAQANLNSTLDKVTGYIAKNGASFSNSGNIVFTGKETTGIQVLEGSTGGNSGSITVQDGSVGLSASSSGAATTLNNTGSLVLKGGTNADRTTGISATGSAVTVNMSAGTIDMQGQGAVGVSATAGAKVNLTGTSAVTFAAEPTGITDQIAFLVSGAGSTINTNTSGTGLVASGKNSTLIRLENGATQSGVLNMGATGTGSRGIWATGAGTSVTALSGSTFNVGGDNAMAVLVQGGAEGNLKAGTTVNLTGTNTIVGTVDGNEYAIDGVTVLNTNTGSKLNSDATLNSTTAGATGFITQNQGILTNNGTINFQGANSQAVKVLDGTFINTANISANGTAVYVEGAKATVQNNGGAILATDGKAAVELGTGANLNLVGSGVNTVEGQGTAHAVLVDSGATGLTVSGAHLIVNAAGASGNGIENAGNIAGIQLNDTTIDVMNGKGVRTSASLDTTNSGTINVAGSGTGLAFEDAAGAAMGNNVDLSGSSALNINVTGANGTGISVKHTGNGEVKNAANVTVAAGGGSAVALSGVSTFENAGKLNTASTANVVDLGATKSVTNSGEINAASATGAALTFDAQDSTLSNTGKIIGVVDLGAGANTATNAAGASITGNIISATGNNTVTNSGTIVGDIALGSGTNNVTLNAGSTVVNVSGTTGVNNVTVKGDAAFTALEGGIGGGADTVTFDGATHTLSATSDIDHFENMKLINGSTINTADLIKMTDTAGGAGSISIDGTSTLAIAAPADYTLNHALSGNGKIDVTSGTQFDFGAAAGNQFAGRVNMNSAEFALSGLNTTALTKATLSVMGNNTTTVGNGIQNIGGLSIDGGTMNFGVTIPNSVTSDSFIAVAGTLDASGIGKIQVTKGSFDNATVPVVNKTLGLLDQQNETLVQLVSAQTAIGGAGALQLIDENGAAISNGSVSAISQNGVHAADGTYDYRLTTSGDKGNGLYVAYGLTQLDLLTSGTDKLVINTADSTEKTLSAKVIGSGDLGIVAGNGADALTISNVTNSYTGETDLQTGTLTLGTDNALGQTSKLTLADSTTANVNGKTQTVGELATAQTSQLNLDNGNLTVTHGGQVDGSLAGAGQLTLTGDTLSLTQNNSGFTGTTDINAGATARVTQPQGLGQGVINNEGTLNLDGAAGTLLNSLKGTQGDVLLTQDADITLGGNNTDYAGTFTTTSGTTLTSTASEQLGSSTVHNDGTFVLDTAEQWAMNNTVDGSGTVVKRGTGTVLLDGNNVSAGLTTIENGVLQVGGTPGTASQAILTSNVNITEQGTLGGYGQVVGNVDNSGNLTMGRALTGGAPSEFTINGNYTGNNGTVTFNTDLGDDNSATDKLIIKGDTAGQSQVVVMSARGEGAQTVEGIKLIDVGGSSNGEFTLKGRAVAGAYEYFLNKGGVSTPNDGDWYLRSVLPAPVNPDTPVNPETPDTPVAPVTPVTPTPTNSVVRPEAGSYMANMAAANKMFNLRLEDREGRAENSSMWLRQQGDRNKFRDNSGQIKTATNTYVVQGGGEVAQTQFTDTDRLGVGLMLGYGKSDSQSRNHRSGYNSRGQVDGYSGGVYATWYQDAKTLDGLYVDSWVQYSMLNASVHGDQLSSESYDMNGLSASVESGYRIPVYQGENGNVFVTPQAQITWNGIKADDHKEANGTRVSSDGNNNVQTRLGVKLSRDGVSDMDKGSDKLFTVYTEANWLHNTEQAGATMDGVAIKQAGSANIGELKVGAEGQLNKHVNLWTNVAQQLGNDGYSDTAVTVGFKYKF
ncbi:autotransporter outer membrane beta-barrel domain-containing protein [Limnobaculum parvum]|uniref:Autotransporter outer membrane beta-barrel domain-containing protein n=1 Tax=Limnobaculum parvum TaxID=2172103 RepID=A0A2Y9TWC1_9GAMM|nr:autotransporter outer membrane beta-barrel domain-containing protein [Limnobaculum parvum]AWH88003.1 autotransporter outer membrane beta-barrel domain-containing protein [Limnobaculum parvum]